MPHVIKPNDQWTEAEKVALAKKLEAATGHKLVFKCRNAKHDHSSREFAISCDAAAMARGWRPPPPPSLVEIQQRNMARTGPRRAGKTTYYDAILTTARQHGL